MPFAFGGSLDALAADRARIEAAQQQRYFQAINAALAMRQESRIGAGQEAHQAQQEQENYFRMADRQRQARSDSLGEAQQNWYRGFSERGQADAGERADNAAYLGWKQLEAYKEDAGKQEERYKTLLGNDAANLAQQYGQAAENFKAAETALFENENEKARVLQEGIKKGLVQTPKGLGFQQSGGDAAVIARYNAQLTGLVGQTAALATARKSADEMFKSVVARANSQKLTPVGDALHDIYGRKFKFKDEAPVGPQMPQGFTPMPSAPASIPVVAPSEQPTVAPSEMPPASMGGEETAVRLGGPFADIPDQYFRDLANARAALPPGPIGTPPTVAAAISEAERSRPGWLHKFVQPNDAGNTNADINRKVRLLRSGEIQPGQEPENIYSVLARARAGYGPGVTQFPAVASGFRPMVAAPAPVVPARSTVTPQQVAILNEARAAIAKGKDPTAVKIRLQRMGIDPSLL